MNFTQTQITEILMNYANSEDGLNNLLQLSLECLLRSERLAHNKNYDDVSNGYRPRKIMHNGTILEIQIPRTRLHAFKPVILGVLKNQREEIEKLAFSLYTKGLTGEQIGDVCEELYGKNYSKSHISQIMETAREETKLWLNRPLDSEYLAIYIDATFFSTKRENSYSNEAYFVVLGVKKDSTREILGIYNNPTEGSGIWEDFFMDLQKRGVKSMQLVVTDGLIGIENTIAKYFPMADIQLCTVHLKRNMIHKVKPEDKAKLALDLKEIFDPFKDKTPENAYTFFTEKMSTWVKKYPALKSFLVARTALYFTFFKYPIQIRNMIYSTNWIERFNKSAKRILKTKGSLPSTDAVIFLMANLAQNIKAYHYKVANFKNIF